MAETLECSRVCVSFGDRVVLKEVSIALTPGGRTALLGASGSGKTTLLRILAGLLEPGSGRIGFNGKSPEHALLAGSTLSVGSRAWVWPEVSMVFQDLRLFPNLTGEENALLGLNQTDGVKARLLSLAMLLGVDACLGKKPRKMSQGEQQRIAILRALARNPKYLLLDEPTSALDPFARKTLAELLADICASTKMGLLFATHDWEFASALAKNHFTLHNGNGVLSSTLQEAVEHLTAH